MPQTAQPCLVVDADDVEDYESPAHQALLAWARSEGINPEDSRRFEVYEGIDGKAPYAIVTMYEVDENGRKILDEVSEECVTYTEIVPLSSLPPSREV